MTSNEPSVLVHVGLMKSGSTSLQQNLFAKHSDILNIWKPSFDQLLRQMINVEDNDLRLEDTEDFLKENLTRAQKENKALVLSNEQISGLPVLWPAAHRIKQFLPNAKIFLCIREQRALIESYYIHQSRNLGGIFGVPERYSDLPITFDEFFSFHFPGPGKGRIQTQKFLRISWRLRYLKTAGLYQDLFGRDNVLVLPIEMAGQHPNEFASRLEAFCGINGEETARLLGLTKRNVGVEKSHVVYERWRHQLPEGIAFSKFVPFGNRLRKIIKAAASRRSGDIAVWDEDKMAKLTTLYAKQNKEVQRLFGLQLDKYNYLLD